MKFDSAFPQRVAKTRASLGLTQAELAKSVGVVHRQIAAYEGGEAKPRYAALQNLAAALGTTSDWLSLGIGKGPSLESIKPTKTVTEIPLLTWSQASMVGFLDDLIPDDFHQSPPSSPEDAFAIKIIGDAMTSNKGVSFPEGSIVTFSPSIQPNSGDFVLLKTTDLFATFKQVFFSGNSIKVHSLNDLYPEWHASKDDVDIVAVAIYVETKLK